MAYIRVDKRAHRGPAANTQGRTHTQLAHTWVHACHIHFERKTFSFRQSLYFRKEKGKNISKVTFLV